MTATGSDFFPVFADWARKKGLNDAKQRFAPALGVDELASYVIEYEKRIGQVETTVPFVLAGPRKPWYPGPNEETDVYWPLLEEFMKSSLGWDKERRRVVDHSSSKVVAYTPDPVNRTWDSKGLVVGYVQSGKTTNYTAVIAKAADVGYKLIIVLSGIHNGLRRQTQERLDEQLTGLSETTWLPLTTTDRDFYRPTMGLAALMHGDEQKVALCVAKKNAAVLRRLDRWLETASKQRVLTDVPTLVIDDEADQASVETKTVNPLIKSILGKLPRCTYVGYTATPFANVLINPAGGELYPKSFILNLPRPDGYFGTERIFGRDQVEGDEATGADLDGYDMVRIVPDEEIDDLRPAGKQSAVDFEPSLTPSLTAAMRWFWLATAARRARGDHDHSTMLVHTAIKIDVHRAYRDPVEGALAAAALAVFEGDESFLNELRGQWDAECATVPSGDFDLHPVAFDTLLEYLPGVLTECRVVLDNCRSDDRLDYSAPGQVAIVVGGNTLSRGLTLEGLVVSFFVRAAQAYDTLLQMARWFGFRPGYEDLPRIWMTDQLRRWFRHLALVEHEIRLDIERYEQQNLTPLEFGVRIRTHPILRITAKMGAARPAYASYSGRRVQTRYFRTTDTDWLQGNVDAADALIAAARSADVDTLDRDNGALVYLGVPADLVLQFFADYQPHSESPDLDPELVAKYVRRQLNQGQLEFWNVAVMAGVDGSEHGTVRLGGVEFRRIVRSKLAGTGVQQADIKTLMSKDHRTVDFMEPTEARKLPEVALMERRDQDSVQRNRGLLLIYPIDPVSAPDDKDTKTRSPLNAAGDVIGMGLVFPGQAERATQVPATMVSVDLSDAEIEHEPAELASLEGDDDQDGGA